MRFGIGVIGLGDGGLTNARVIAGFAQEGATAQTIGVGVVDLNNEEGLPNARALAGVEGVRLVALCDPDEARRVAAAEEFPGVAVLGDYDEMLRNPEVDLVVVATPDHAHYSPAWRALASGMHVFVEKPLGTSQSDLSAFRDILPRFAGRLQFSEKYSFAYPIEVALRHRAELGEFLWGDTLYTMWRCGRIMGNGKWRTETEYNPVAGGLSHNFMTASLLAGSPIAEISARGEVLTYHENLDRTGGFDTMMGTLRFASGRFLNWAISLAAQGDDSPFGHRTVTHTLQFARGALVYGSFPHWDSLTIDGLPILFSPEPAASAWADYNVGVLYRRMWRNIIGSILNGTKPRHTVEDGINVAEACILAFQSAKRSGRWLRLEGSQRFRL